MRKNELMNLFGLTEQDFDKVVDSASKWIEGIVNEAMNNKDTKSYFNTKGCSYENGKLTRKFEKEYVNGECVKDVKYDNKKEAESLTHDNRTSKMSHTIRKLENENSGLKTQCENYHNQIVEMTTYIDGLNDKIKKLEIEKSQLQSVVNNIKNCF